jgi:hypothetical protein
MNAARALLIVDGHDGVRAALTQRLQRALGAGIVASAGDLSSAARAIQELTPTPSCTILAPYAAMPGRRSVRCRDPAFPSWY